MKPITPELLRKHKACGDQVKLFEEWLKKKGWKSARPTPENIQDASKAGLNVFWANDNGLIILNGFIELPIGTKEWYQNGKLHREDGPAVEYSDGTKCWYINGKLHREDGPAVELPTGTKEWYQNGKLHREDGPAVELSDGTKEWYQNDALHREDGPAIEYPSGAKYWYKNGQLKRPPARGLH